MPRRASIAPLAVLACAAALRANAGNTYWTGVASSLYSDPTNWSGGVPDGSGNVFFRESDISGSKTVFADSSYSYSARTYIDAGTGEAPLVFAALDGTCGISASGGNLYIASGSDAAAVFAGGETVGKYGGVFLKFGDVYLGDAAGANSASLCIGNNARFESSAWLHMYSGLFKVTGASVAFGIEGQTAAIALADAQGLSATAVFDDAYVYCRKSNMSGWKNAKALIVANADGTSAALHSTNSTVNANGAVVVANGSRSSAIVEKISGRWQIYSSANNYNNDYGRLCIGYGRNSFARFYHRGGVLLTADSIVMGCDPNAAGDALDAYFEISGGTVAITNFSRDVIIGEYGVAGSSARVKVCGDGLLTTADIAIGDNTSGKLEISGGGVVDASNGTVYLSRTSSEEGETSSLSVADGGTLKTRGIAYGSGAGAASVLFDDGTLVAAADGVLVAKNANLAVSAGPGGAVLDTAGFTVSCASGISAADGGGEVSVSGGGTLALQGVCASGGDVVVESGTALAGGPGSSVAGRVVLRDGALLGSYFQSGVPATLTAEEFIFEGDSVVLPLYGNIPSPGVYPVVSISGDGTFSQADLSKFSLDADVEGFSLALSQDCKSILAVQAGGEGECVWTGAVDADLGNPANWMGGATPDGTVAVIGAAALATLSHSDAFAPSSIVFPSGSAKLTIAPGSSTRPLAPVSIRNESTAHHEFTVAVDFKGRETADITVSADSWMEFSGGISANRVKDTGEAAFYAGVFTLSDTEDWGRDGKDDTSVGAPGAGCVLNVPGIRNDSAEVSHLSVLSGSRLVVSGDAAVSADAVACRTAVDANLGEIEIAGLFKSEGMASAYFCKSGSGTVSVAGIEQSSAGQHVKLNNNSQDGGKWKIGAGGISRTSAAESAGRYFWFEKGAKTATIVPAESFSIDAPVNLRTAASGASLFVSFPSAADGEESATVSIAQAVSGEGAMAFEGKGTARFGCACTFTGGLSASGAARVEVASGAKPGTGAVSLSGGAALVLEDASAPAEFSGALTLSGGATVEIDNYGGVAAAAFASIAYGGASDGYWGGKTKLILRGALPLPSGAVYGIIEAPSGIGDGVLENISLEIDDVLSGGGKCRLCAYQGALCVAVGELPGIWCGATGNGDLCDGRNWLDGNVPDGKVAHISGAAGAEFNLSGVFAPASLQIGSGSGALTFVDSGNGEGRIVCSGGIVNEASAHHVFNVPVVFPEGGEAALTMSKSSYMVFSHLEADAIAATGSDAYYAGNFVLRSSGDWAASARDVSYIGDGTVETCVSVPSAVCAETAVTKLRIAKNGTFAVGGDFTVSASSAACRYFTAKNDGALDVSGSMKSSGLAKAYPASEAGSGVFKAGGVVSAASDGADSIKLNAGDSSHSACKWVVGDGGFSRSGSYQFFIDASGAGATIQPSGEVLRIACNIGVRSPLVVDASAYGTGLPALVEQRGVFYRDGPASVTGGGKLALLSGRDTSSYTVSYSVGGNSTLSLGHGAKTGSGVVSVASGSTLEIAGEASAGGAVRLEQGSTLAFEYPAGGANPRLDLSGSLSFASPSVKVATYNVRCVTGKDTDALAWSARKEALVAYVRRVAPDVVGFQEANAEQRKYLEAQLTEYAFVSDKIAADEAGSREYVPVAYLKSRFSIVNKESGTFWLSDTPAKKSKLTDSQYYRICTWANLKDSVSGRTFCFANTHIDLVDGVKKSQVETILSRLGAYDGGDSSLVVLGDMNFLETHEAFTAATNTLSNALYVAKAAAGPWRTLNQKQTVALTEAQGIYPIPEALALPVESRSTSAAKNNRIDHVFVSRGVEVRRFESWGLARHADAAYYPSDHFMQTADILLPGAATASSPVVVTATSSRGIAGPAKLQVTSGAHLSGDENFVFVAPEWVEKMAVEDGEIVIYRAPAPFRITIF